MMARTARAEDQEPIKAEENGVSGPVIGIDLGTTYSCVGIMKNGKVDIMVNDQGNRITPSWVAFTDEERLVGDAAKNQYASNPHRTIFDVVSSTPSPTWCRPPCSHGTETSYRSQVQREGGPE